MRQSHEVQRTRLLSSHSEDLRLAQRNSETATSRRHELALELDRAKGKLTASGIQLSDSTAREHALVEKVSSLQKQVASLASAAHGMEARVTLRRQMQERAKERNRATKSQLAALSPRKSSGTDDELFRTGRERINSLFRTFPAQDGPPGPDSPRRQLVV